MTNPNNEIAVIAPQPTALDILPDQDTVERELARIRTFQALVKASLVKDRDFGIIPGTNKPTLLKPGAEKITSLVKVKPHYEIMDKTTDWESGLFAYEIRCVLIHIASGVEVDEGVGECNSNEDKYRYRWLWPNQLADAGLEGIKDTLKFKTTQNGGKQYRVENEERASQRNTILKMAKKRALVDAALSVASLSDLFTQDMEEMKGSPEVNEDPGSGESTQGYWCPEHETEFYKRGKMRGYAHKQGEGWHNMPSEPAPDTREQPEQTSSPRQRSQSSGQPDYTAFYTLLKEAKIEVPDFTDAAGMSPIEWLSRNGIAMEPFDESVAAVVSHYEGLDTPEPDQHLGLDWDGNRSE